MEFFVYFLKWKALKLTILKLTTTSKNKNKNVCEESHESLPIKLIHSTEIVRQ